MKFSTPFTLAATTLFLIIGSTDAHLRGHRSLETTDDVGGGCTGASQDPFALGKDNKVPCCAGLEEELKDWDGDGRSYYKCMAKETGNFKCYHGGCPEDGGSLVKNCSNCVDGMTCANSGHGIWLDCSDDNRMLEVKQVTGTSDTDDHRSLETTDDVDTGNFKCYHGGCPEDGGALVKNCSNCVDGMTCANSGHGIWLDCSDDNRMLEVKQVTGTSDTDDHRSLETTDDVDTGNFKCYHGGCPEDGGALVKNCSNCVDGMTCANSGHGIWLDCSDDNRMLEVKQVTGTSDTDDHRSLETTDDVDTGNFKCYHGGCPEDGGALVKNCSNCVDGMTCANSGHGIWLDCSDDNRMLEVKQVTGTSDTDDHRSLETTDDVDTGNFKCYHGGCPEDGGALVKNCSNCVDGMTCANSGHGIWLDCSDENRMI